MLKVLVVIWYSAFWDSEACSLYPISYLIKKSRSSGTNIHSLCPKEWTDNSASDNIGLVSASSPKDHYIWLRKYVILVDQLALLCCAGV